MQELVFTEICQRIASLLGAIRAIEEQLDDLTAEIEDGEQQVDALTAAVEANQQQMLADIDAGIQGLIIVLPVDAHLAETQGLLQLHALHVTVQEFITTVQAGQLRNMALLAELNATFRACKEQTADLKATFRIFNQEMASLHATIIQADTQGGQEPAVLIALVITEVQVALGGIQTCQQQIALLKTTIRTGKGQMTALTTAVQVQRQQTVAFLASIPNELRRLAKPLNLGG